MHCDNGVIILGVVDRSRVLVSHAAAGPSCSPAVDQERSARIAMAVEVPSEPVFGPSK